ncbi:MULTISPECIES: purine-cytosine permease family protein [Rhodococcus]|uniref:Cytosine permease n=1 Tax=Rhodococcus qingshengii JCM 15477 TaxID=1303681 RepID=A0AB38RPI5_RHOSG|nr:MULTISPECIES: cytosine permease [Rhodococcus]MCC4306714.1 cytosine permease [Rhodococcus sp. 3-2]OMQ28738.1 nitrate reductase [Rhodococcus sp. D-1]UPU47045.1 cytosine permease [Rhodococcus qingshengii JCM 15477]
MPETPIPPDSSPLIESYGVEPIPPEARTSTPWDFLRIATGSVLTTATVLLGTLPIALGLSFAAAATAIVCGVMIGALLLAPLASIGQRSHTNNAVSSGAHFGVTGRVVGSVLSLLVAVTFFTLSVWVCGDAVVSAVGLFAPGLANDATAAVAYGLAALATFSICIVGYRWLLAANKFLAPAMLILMALGFVALGGQIDLGYPGTGEYAVGGFWTTWFAALLIVMANPISYSPFLGDWSRYVPQRFPARRLRLAVVVAQISSLVPFLFGAATASVVPDAGAYVAGLVDISPAWYVAPLIVVLIGGSLGGSVSSLYGTGLDFSSVVPRLNRMQATVAIGAVSIVLVFLGRFVFNLVDTVNAFTTLILVLAAPWVSILLVGYLTRRGHYLVEDLQVFNRGQQGGAYWFTRGYNVRTMIAWGVGAVLGLSTANTALIAGPLKDIAGGIDVSFFLSFLVSGAIYYATLLAFPEPGYVFPEAGGRFVPSGPVSVPAPPIVTVDADLARRRAPSSSELMEEHEQHLVPPAPKDSVRPSSN